MALRAKFDQFLPHLNDDQTGALADVAEVIAAQGAVPGLQLSHAGHKPSRSRPFGDHGDRPLTPAEGGWTPLAPSALAFRRRLPRAHRDDPRPDRPGHQPVRGRRDPDRRTGLSPAGTARRHGRLLHSYLSPLANQRTDAYGGSFTNRTRLLRQTVQAVRQAWPAHLPLAVRLSCTDFLTGGWRLKDTLGLVPLLAEDGADLIDCTSGGIARPEPRPTGPCWQAPYAAAVRARTGVPTAAVGKITSLEQAARLLSTGTCDLALMGRQLLIDPMLPARHAPDLAPPPYRRALATVSTPADGHLPPEL